MKRLVFLVSVALCLLLVRGAWAARIYVSPDGTGDGGSAASPADLQTALDTARTNGQSDRLLLASGVYDASAAGANTFEFHAEWGGSDGEDVLIEGGWNPDFTSQVDDATATALDGGGSARVLWVGADGAGAVAYLVVENLTISNGKTATEAGAGIYASQSLGGSVTLEATAVIFAGNVASSANGGAIASSGALTLFWCTFAANLSQYSGGGAIFASGPVAVSDSTFTSNQASSGGAVYLTAAATPATFLHSDFSDNACRSSGGGFGSQGCSIYSASPSLVVDGGDFRGMTDGSTIGNGSTLSVDTGGFLSVRNTAFRNAASQYWGSAIGLRNAGADVYNCLFANNRAGAPPALGGKAAVTYLDDNGGTTETVRIGNSTFVGNTAAGDVYGDLAIDGGNLTVSNSIFDGTTLQSVACYNGCTGSIDYSAVERGAAGISGLTYGEFNTTDEPSFQTGDPDYKLDWTSTLIETGDNAAVPAWLLTDFKGAPRVFASAKDREHPRVDLGWDEYIDYTLTLTAPTAGGTLVNNGTPKSITWYCHNIGGNVGLSLWKGPEGSLVKKLDIATVPCSDQAYSWTIPASLRAAANYALVIVPGFYPTIDRVAAPLTIKGTLALLSPNGGQGLVQGSTIPITWKSRSLPGALVRIELYRGATLARTIATGAPNTGSFSWKVPYAVAPGTTYKLKLSTTSPSAAQDWSDSVFSILPAVTLTAPNGGQSVKRGTTYRIAWTYKNSPGAAVRLDLYKGGALAGTIVASTPLGTAGKGFYDWKVPATQTPAATYTIRVRSTANPNCFDFSNAAFTITQ